MDVIDGEEVQRGRHLGVENVKQHRLDHQDKGDEHFVAPGFIKAKRLAEKERNDHDRQDNQHQVGDHHVMHQPGAEKNHYHRTGQHQRQIAQAEGAMIGLGTNLFHHPAAGEVDQQRDNQPRAAQVIGHRVAKLFRDHRRQRQRQQRTDVYRHIKQGKRPVETGILRRIAF